MVENNFGHPAIPKFDGHYDHWSMLMENLLRSEEYWSIVEGGVPVLAATATAEQRKLAEEGKLKDLMAKNYLFQSIDRSIIETVLDKSSSKAIWESMAKKFQGSTKVKRARLQALRGEFGMLRMKEEESVNDFFGRVLATVNKMKIQGENMEESIVVEKILRSMTEKFNYVVCAIEESNNVETLSIDELQGSLLVHERKMKPIKQEDQALKVTYGDRNAGRGRGRGAKGGQGRGKRINKETIECYKCHKLGHFQYECPNVGDYANYADNEEVLLMAFDKSHQESTKKQIWYLDSGCINHMCGVKEWFHDLDMNFKETVRLRDNSQMSVVGKGNVKLQLNGFTQIITDVYYIPELKNNLLSIGQLQLKDLTIVFKRNWCKVYHQDKGMIMSSQMASNKLYPIFAEAKVACFQTKSEDISYLWHCRYGHLNFKGLQTLQQKNMVKDLPKIEESDHMCTNCLVGKQHRESIPKTSNLKSSKRLELVHSDICGPITPASNSDNRYFLTFIDDYSRKTWAYFLKNKSSALEYFKKFKNMVEKETGESICCLRTDRGGEFNSNEFNNFCEVNGIKRQVTAAYTPQQNGIAKRKNRTIMDMVRSMISGKDIPKVFWPEAVNWAIYVLNRSPAAAIPDVTPEEFWSSSKPTVKHFRIFGCIAYTHVPDAQRRKFDDKSVKCIFLGISKESKAYRLYNPMTKKIIVSRDVKFAEFEKWKWNEKTEPSKLHTQDSDEETDKEMNNGEDGEELIVQPTNEHTPTNNNSTEDIGTSNSNLNQGRTRRPPGWYSDYDTSIVDEESMNLVMFGPCVHQGPINFEEAEKSQKWRKAMDDEIAAIERNNTWELTKLPKNARVIGVKWIYKTKVNDKGEVEKFKARLVAKRYAQRYGTDYKEVFAPVARWNTIRSLSAIAASNEWSVFQLDVKSAFLHGELNEIVYVEQPLGYVKKGKEDQVYRLHKALYELKQAPRALYSKIEQYFVREGFEKCPHEHTLFVKKDGNNNWLIISLYVDDLIFTGNNHNMVEKFKNSMMNNFDMSDLGKMRHFLGIEAIQCDQGIFVCQQRYAQEILERFNMDKSNAVCSPIVSGTKLSKHNKGDDVNPTQFKQIVGSLMYLTATRPDLMFAVNMIARYMEHSVETHMMAAKRILRYIKGTLELGILYKKGKQAIELIVCLTRPTSRCDD
ncbi:copia-type polyprotein [Trifolium pratense]|uniref:Copia-type polyprotein n=1 Tax=Trifolium pratense TaxID=57577 RepID=A0A2K3MUU4_TRIPR|nr:copia-type polyprotein [Trifolium pratense]